DIGQGHAELVGDDLGQHRLMPLTLGRQAGGDLDLAAGFDLHVPAFIGAHTGPFDVARHADAYLAALGSGFVADLLEIVPVDQRFDLVHQTGVIARVVGQGAPVLEYQSALIVGELIGLDEVRRPHFCAVFS